jgi:hypothetical protein
MEASGSGELDNDSFDLSGIKELQNVNTSIILLLFVIGVPWNALVIAIILRKKLFTVPSMTLMLNLAIVNFFVCLFIYPPTIVFSIKLSKQNFIITRRDITILTQACQSGILLVLLPSLSVYTVALMAVDRVIYLSKPLSYERIVTPWRMFTAIVVVWVVVITISLPPLFGFGSVGIARGYICVPLIESTLDRIALLLGLSLIAIATLVEVIGSGIIIYITRKHLLRKLRRTLSLFRSRSSDASQARREKGLKEFKQHQLQLVKVFAATLSASILTYIPLVVFGIVALAMSTEITRVNDYFTALAYTSLLSRSVLHPIVESYLAKELRDVIAMPYRACVQRCRKKIPNDSSVTAKAAGTAGTSTTGAAVAGTAPTSTTGTADTSTAGAAETGTAGTSTSTTGAAETGTAGTSTTGATELGAAGTSTTGAAETGTSITTAVNSSADINHAINSYFSLTRLK